MIWTEKNVKLLNISMSIYRVYLYLYILYIVGILAFIKESQTMLKWCILQSGSEEYNLLLKRWRDETNVFQVLGFACQISNDHVKLKSRQPSLCSSEVVRPSSKFSCNDAKQLYILFSLYQLSQFCEIKGSSALVASAV